MGDSFFEFIRQIGVFILCAQCLIHFCAGKSYEKYVRLLVGIMVLAQFITPVSMLFFGAGRVELAAEVKRFGQELSEATQKNPYPEQREKDTFKALEEEMADRLSQKAEEYGFTLAEVKLDEEKILIFLHPQRQEKETGRIQMVEVKVGESKETTTGTSPVAELVREFSILLGIHQDYLEIEWEEGGR
ncbi:MAG: stage III sporulation protein AF [Lachnospiraceae bacterium]|nr:stage III sporulation protein AF [Lachnospiraceae bacterium]